MEVLLYAHSMKMCIYKNTFVYGHINKSIINLKQWVNSGEDSYHLPVVLEMEGRRHKPSIPFKFNSIWFKEEEFQSLLGDSWTPFDPKIFHSTMDQFENNIKKLKHATIRWATQMKVKHARSLKDVEEALQDIYVYEGGGFLTNDTKEAML